MFPVDLLQGKVALVTGASSETGPTIARTFGEVGADVALTYLTRAESAEKVVSEVEANGVRAKAYRFDLLEIDTIKPLVDEVVADFGRLDFLINCAATRLSPPVKELHFSDWDHCVDGNLKACFFLARDAAQVMEAGDGGAVVNFSATSAMKYSHSVYGLAKAAVISMTRFLASTFAPKVRVNCIIPGLIDNPEYGIEGRRKRAADTPLGRIVNARDLGLMCVAMCSPLFETVTGEAVIMDGGFWLKHV
ncbi:MAG: SDR family oxidoreductase [Fidelibacterota bacterium]|nr:MAG: SDR family oxidoreductase [Candidatus Neomarinimicrobiota bacterium]